jgi:hypothetical protein
VKRKRKERSLSSFEKNLMRALHLKNVRQLDALMKGTP